MALIATVDANGIASPSYEDILAQLKSSYRSIYGADTYLESDSQDGQALAIEARAIYDMNAAIVASFNSYSPATAVGVGLSSVVKTNGIARLVPSRSSATVTVVGTTGTVITNGVVKDTAGNLWNLPATVTIPLAASIAVTATAQKDGAITAPANTITQIATPTRGWQSVTNPAAAAVGAPVETDSQLRLRQSRSVAIPSQTVLEGLAGAVANIAGVTAVSYRENDTGATDSNGLPAKSIAVVVQGGDTATIARTIARKKSPGAYTYGTTTMVIADDYGSLSTIRFFRPTDVPINVEVTIKSLTGYTSQIGDMIKQQVAAYINSMGVDGDVIIPRLYTPAQLNFGPGYETFELTGIKVAIKPAAPTTSNITIAFNQIASSDVADITLVVTT